MLVVDDASDHRELISEHLSRDGFDVHTAPDGRRGVESARALSPEVIVLDLGLPDLDGLEVARRIRGFSNAYIVMVTARDQEIDKLAGLSAGADDYLTKPISLRELSARLEAMLRRPREPPAGAEVRRAGDLEIDPAAREVRLAGAVVELTRIEFDLLDALSAKPKVVFTRRQLLERVWGPNWHADDHVVTVHLSSLRRKLGDDPASPRYIVTVRGVGYRFGG